MGGSRSICVEGGGGGLCDMQVYVCIPIKPLHYYLLIFCIDAHVLCLLNLEISAETPLRTKKSTYVGSVEATTPPRLRFGSHLLTEARTASATGFSGIGTCSHSFRTSRFIPKTGLFEPSTTRVAVRLRRSLRS